MKLYANIESDSNARGAATGANKYMVITLTEKNERKAIVTFNGSQIDIVRQWGAEHEKTTIVLNEGIKGTPHMRK